MGFAILDVANREYGMTNAVLFGALPQTPRFFAFWPLAQVKKEAVTWTARAIRPHRGARVASQQSPIPRDVSFSIPAVVVSGKAKFFFRESFS
jgi:hypothetical protein